MTLLRIDQEETFGPVIGIQKVTSLHSQYLFLTSLKVSSDEEAIKLMNDSIYGLTASIWTNAAANPDSQEAFLVFVDELQTGTVFLNRQVSHCVSSPFDGFLGATILILRWLGLG